MPEALQDLGYLEPEVRSLDFLLRSTPCNVIREKVSEKSLREMDAEPPEEEEAGETELDGDRRIGRSVRTRTEPN